MTAESIIAKLTVDYTSTVKFQLTPDVRVQFACGIDGFWVRVWLKVKGGFGEIKLAQEKLSHHDLLYRLDDLIGQDLLPCW